MWSEISAHRLPASCSSLVKREEGQKENLRVKRGEGRKFDETSGISNQTKLD